MKKSQILAALILCLIGAMASVAAFADPITFTFIGTDSGSLGGTSFGTSAITITAVADTANLVSNPCCGATSAVVDNSTVVTIGGLGTFTFTSQTQMWWINSLDSGGLGAYDGDPATILGGNLIDVGGGGFAGWNENTPIGPVIDPNGEFLQWNDFDEETNGGRLMLDAGGSITSFQASTTPEPSSILLFGSGLLGLAGLMWRRLRRLRI